MIVNSPTFVWIWKLTKLFCFHTHLCLRQQAFHLFFLHQRKRQPFSPWRSIHGSLLHHDPLLSCVICSLFLLTFPPACTKNTNLPSTLGTLELLSLLFSSSKNRFLSHLCILCAASLLLTSEAVCTHISSCKRQSGCVLFEMSSSTRPVSPPPPPHCLSCCPFIFPPCVGAHQGSIFYPPCAYTYSPSLTDSNDFYNLTADSQIQTSLLGSMFYTCVSAGHFYLDS